MFKVNEIKSWAKKFGITVKKQGEGYVWFKEDLEAGVPTSLDELVTGVYNHITDNKFLDHQKKYLPTPII
jgi:hypothetical protein